MNDKVEDFIKEKLSEESEILVSIFKEMVKKYPNETKRQHAIRGLVKKFNHDYPKLMEEFYKELKKKRELAKNKHAADYDNEIRQMFALPDGLQTRIRQVFDRIGEKYSFLSLEEQEKTKESDWFAKEFPQFLVPEIY